MFPGVQWYHALIAVLAGEEEGRIQSILVMVPCPQLLYIVGEREAQFNHRFHYSITNIGVYIFLLVLSSPFFLLCCRAGVVGGNRYVEESCVSTASTPGIYALYTFIAVYTPIRTRYTCLYNSKHL